MSHIVAVGVTHKMRTVMRLSDNLKHNSLRFIGMICIIFGLFAGFDAIQLFLDAEATVVINGVKRSDAEAKLMQLYIPAISVVVGIALTLMTKKDLVTIRRAQNTFWSIFKK